MSFPWPPPISAHARAAVGDLDADVPLVSGRLLAAAAGHMGGPVLEIRATRAAALAGFLRACRQQDAVAVVAVDAAVRARDKDAGRLALQGIAMAAVAARHDRPLLVVARAPDGPDGLPLEARLARDLAAGFGAIGVSAGELEDITELEEIARIAAAHDVAIELELPPDMKAPHRRIVEAAVARGLPLGAIDGVDGATGPITRRIVLTPPDLVAPDAGSPRRCDVDAIIAAITGTPDDVEVRVWLETSRLLRRLGGAGTSGRLVDAIERLARGAS